MSLAVLATGAPARKKLDACRRELAKAADDLEAVEEALLPAEVAAERAMSVAVREIDRARATLAGLFGSRVAGTLEGDEVMELQRRALLKPAEMRKELVELFRAHGLGAGTSDQERADKLRALNARRLTLLADEEGLTRDLEQAGFLVDRNTDTDPEVLLRVWEARA